MILAVTSTFCKEGEIKSQENYVSRIQNLTRQSIFDPKVQFEKLLIPLQ